MTRSARYPIATVALALLLCVSACSQNALPTATPLPATATPTRTPTNTPTVTPTLTATPTLTPSPTPQMGLGLSRDELRLWLTSLSQVVWSSLSETAQVGALSRLEAETLAGEMMLVAIAQGEELLSLEITVDTSLIDQASSLGVLGALLEAALPNWPDGDDWLQEALAAPAGNKVATPAAGTVRAEALRQSADRDLFTVLLSTLPYNGDTPADQLRPFDPTVGLGLGRYALQWAFEGLPTDGRMSFRRAQDRLGQPVVVGTSSDNLATLTLVGPEDELVYAALSLAVPEGDTTAESKAVALGQQLMRVVFPEWTENCSWIATAVRGALVGGRYEQRRSGARLLVQRDAENDRLVDISLSGVLGTLPPLTMPTATPFVRATTVTITGLPPEELAHLTAVFERQGVEVARLAMPPNGIVTGPEADQVTLEGDALGLHPWADYWVSSSRVSVIDGAASFAFMPIKHE